MTEEKLEEKLKEAPVPNVVLRDGKEIFFDFNAVSFSAMLGIFDKKEPAEKTNTTVSKVCGFSNLEEFYAQGAKDVRTCQREVVKAWINWQNDPKD